MTNLKYYDELRKTEPFRPFRIVTSDGGAFDIPHPEFTWRIPNGGLILVATDDGESFKFIDPLHITRFETIPTAKKGSRRAKK